MMKYACVYVCVRERERGRMKTVSACFGFPLLVLSSFVPIAPQPSVIDMKNEGFTS